MKTTFSVLAALLFVLGTCTSWAGPSQLDLSSVIDENVDAGMAMEKEMVEKGDVTNATREAKKAQAPRGRQILGVIGNDSVAAPSGSTDFSKRRDPRQRDLMKKNLKRVAQEVSEAGS